MTPFQQMLLGLGGRISSSNIYPDDNFRILDYTGNGSAGHQISNGIDFSDGGMAMIKNYISSSKDWWLVDTVQGTNIQTRTNKTDAAETHSALLTSFNEDGITVANNSQSNDNGGRHQAFCFRKRKKFFDIVKYNGSSSAQSISHSLGSVPGMIWVKRTNSNMSWGVYHRGLNGGSSPWNYRSRFPSVTTESAQAYWGNTAPTSTHFTVGTDAETGANGGEYIAYLFAHNENAFGPNENLPMSYCGYYTGNGSSNGPVLNPGWEPSLLILNRVTGGSSNFYVIDNQRGLTGYDGGDDPWIGLTSDGTSSGYNFGEFRQNGFKILQSNADINANGSRYIYYMVRAQAGTTSPTVPELATNVFHSAMGNNASANPRFKTNFKVSFGFYKNPTAGEHWKTFVRGQGDHLNPRRFQINTTNPYATQSYYPPLSHEGFIENESSTGSDLAIAWKESSGFHRTMYNGTGSNRTVNHDLGAIPEMMWIKRMSSNGKWMVYHKDMHQGFGQGLYYAKYFYMNLNEADGRVAGDNQRWNDTPTSTNFSVGTADDTNKQHESFMCLMFKSVSGISKVGYYVGNGSSSGPYVALGFAPKFILIKRADGNGDWRVFNSVRGFNKSLLLNGSSSEHSTTYLGNNTAGFSLSSSSSETNNNGSEYIYYAHA